MEERGKKDSYIHEQPRHRISFKTLCMKNSVSMQVPATDYAFAENQQDFKRLLFKTKEMCTILCLDFIIVILTSKQNNHNLLGTFPAEAPWK